MHCCLPHLAETDGCGVRCRWDNGSVCDPPIYAGFGPQNITVIMSQESHYWNAFLIRIHFPHPPKYGSYGSYYTPLERSLSRPPGCLDGDIQLPKTLP